MRPCAPEPSDWIEALLELSQQEAIGAVGGCVLFADGTIDSAGRRASAKEACRSRRFGESRRWTRGHLSNVLDVRNCAAVSGACLMTRRAVFERVGGVDASAGPLFDLDYCLRVRAAGLRVVTTPHARIEHERPLPAAPAAAAALDRLRARWAPLREPDPYYNPNFDQRRATFRLPDP